MRGFLVAVFAFGLSACATTTPAPPEPQPVPVPEVEAAPQPSPPVARPVPPPPAPPEDPPDEIVIETPDRFAALAGWDTADMAPALEAFQRSCESLLQGDATDYLNPNLPQYGTYADWRAPCLAADNAIDPRAYFETFFDPRVLSGEGLLTGYYEPEVEVRIKPDATFSEPILAVPDDPEVQSRPRSDINAFTSRVIAYGRPIDVFFLQIQGSGRLRYGDGRSLRAAYAANNGHRYRSIGRVLIERGELTRDQSAKRNIEAWMAENGPDAARALMNENPRYIFFTEQRIEPGEGPNGAMQVPLTGMGSVAVDPRYHPYGTLVWLDTKLPQRARDYKGRRSALLTVAQDTGSAIKGPLRGDLFFGSGPAAGALAGVMKHTVRWTVLVPKGMGAASESVS